MPDGRRSTLILWGIVGLVVLGIGGRTLLRDGGAGRPGGSTPAVGAPAAATVPTIAGPRAAPAVVVDVAGAVRRPGVYRLRSGARVQEAIRRAGGAAGGADLTLVNRAAKVADGQQIVVPLRTSAAVPGAGAPGTGAAGTHGPISLNAATDRKSVV